MASGASIRGITIEIGADTSKLKAALTSVNSTVSNTKKQLKDVEKLLKLNPKNTELLSQKQKLLGQQIKNTGDKLKELKKTEETLKANGVDENSEQFMALRREIIETENKLKELNKEYKNFGSVGAQQIAAVGEQMQVLGQKVAEVGTKLTQKVTLPIVAAFTAATKSALDFDDGMAKVYTIADESVKPIADMRAELLELSNATGKSAKELSEAAYQALSASVDTADAVDFVATATDLAKAGFLDTASAVDVLTTVINAYGMSADDAKKIADELVQTQNDGKTTVQELAQSMGTIIPTAAALNIPLEQLNAAYAQMTKQGINTANTTTYLNGMFTELADGGSDVAGILKDQTGKTFGQLMADGQSLGDVLKVLQDSVEGDSEAFLNLWGNTRAGRGALALVNAGAEAFNAETEKMEQATGNVSNALETLATPGAKARKALNQVVNAGIKLGDVLAPYVEKAANKISELAEKFQSLSPETQKTIVKVGAIVAAIGPLLTGFGKITKGIGGLLKLAPKMVKVFSAFGVKGLIIAGIVAGIVLLIKNWDKVKAAAQKLASTLKTAWTNIKNWCSEAWNNVKTTTANAWAAVKTSVTTTATNIWTSITTAWANVKNATTTAWNNVKTAISTAITNAKSTVSSIASGIAGAVSSVWNNIKSTATTVWNSIKDAIVNPINTAKSKIDTLVGGITSAFNGLKSAIKLPSIGTGVITIGGHQLTYPKLVWNARAMQNAVMLDGATIFGAMNGNLYGGGERGRELIVSYDKLAEMMGGGGTTNINVVVNASPGMNERQLADVVARRIQQMVNRKGAVWA